MATTKKALALADEFISEWKQRSSVAIALTYDTDSSPLVHIGAGTNGAAGALLKFQPLDWPLAKDILGLAAEVYTPHVIKVNVEANYAGSDNGVADINTWALNLLILSMVAVRGTRVELYVSTNGTAPNATDIADATKLVGSFQPNAQFGMVSSQ